MKRKLFTTGAICAASLLAMANTSSAVIDLAAVTVDETAFGVLAVIVITALAGFWGVQRAKRLVSG